MMYTLASTIRFIGIVFAFAFAAATPQQASAVRVTDIRLLNATEWTRSTCARYKTYVENASNLQMFGHDGRLLRESGDIKSLNYFNLEFQHYHNILLRIKLNASSKSGSSEQQRYINAENDLALMTKGKDFRFQRALVKVTDAKAETEQITWLYRIQIDTIPSLNGNRSANSPISFFPHDQQAWIGGADGAIVASGEPGMVAPYWSVRTQWTQYKSKLVGISVVEELKRPRQPRRVVLELLELIPDPVTGQVALPFCQLQLN